MSGSPRWVALDVARGLAVVAMVIFHLIWDLGHFGYIEPGIPWSAPVKLFGHAIAFSFLFIAGVALALAHKGRIRWGAFWRRFAIIVFAAALVSVGTYIIFPRAYVFFGILHCIAAASVISIPFLRAPWPAALAAAILFFAGAEFFVSPFFDANWLQWLGLATSEPMTQDWRPLFPWAGALLLGVAAGSAFSPVPRERSGGALAFLGRHSLIIYLAHQPLLFGMFTAIAYVAPPSNDAAAFIPACETRCATEGGDKAICRDICACVAREAIGSNALAGAMDDAERGRRLNVIALSCAVDRKQ